MNQIAVVRWIATWIALCGLLLSAMANAHEVRPAYVEIKKISNQQWQVVWKRPVQGEFALRLRPSLSNGWIDSEPTENYVSDTFLTQRWQVRTAADESLAGAALTIDGLSSSITDVLVNVDWGHGDTHTYRLKPDNTALTFTESNATPVALPAMVLIGIEHILLGYDHLLFVLGMLLLVSSRRSLVITVSSFTLAHSLTLGAVSLGYFSLSVPFVEAMITLSIVFLGAEAIRKQRGHISVTIRYPWLVAFGFGLFHGLGFASAFSSIPANTHELVAALLLFNLGVEAGQLLFIGAVFCLVKAFSINTRPAWLAQRAPAYVVGIAGAYWTFQNTLPLFVAH